MTDFKVEGELILVEKVLEKDTIIDKVGVFKGVVKILQFGEKIENKEGLEIGMKVLIRDPKYSIYTCEFTKESYIYRGQILRTVN